MQQSTLTDNAPVILDATCSFAKIWPKHATVRIDIRPETHPDIVMDAKNLQFPDNHFDQIYCDPPHIIRDGDLTRIKQYRRLQGRRSPDLFTRYGVWKNVEEWFDFVAKTNNEFYRTLKPQGKLFYKITEAGGCTKPLDLIIRMTNFRMIEDKTNPVKSNLGRGKTHWITFISKKEILAQ